MPIGIPLIFNNLFFSYSLHINCDKMNNLALFFALIYREFKIIPAPRFFCYSRIHSGFTGKVKGELSHIIAHRNDFYYLVWWQQLFWSFDTTLEQNVENYDNVHSIPHLKTVIRGINLSNFFLLPVFTFKRCLHDVEPEVRTSRVGWKVSPIPRHNVSKMRS